MKLTTLVAGLLCCTLAVGQQEPLAYDYADYYYDDLTDADMAMLEKDGSAPADKGTAAPKDAKANQEEVVEEPVTEATTTTTTTTEEPKGRRKLVSLKSTKINRQRGPRVSRPQSTTEAAKTEDPVSEAPSSGSTPRRTSSTRGRSSNSRLRGRTQTAAETETEVTEEPAKTPARGRFRPSASRSQSEPSSSRFKPSRSNSFRPSSRSSNTEEESQPSSTSTSSNRFRPSRSRTRGSSSSPAVTEEPENNHRFASSRRGGRGNSRGGSSFRPSKPRSQEPEADAAAPEGEEEAVTESTRRSRLGRRG